MPTSESLDVGTRSYFLLNSGVFGKGLLRSDKAGAEGKIGKRKLDCDGYLFERADDGDRVHVVEEADVSDAEQRALHLALTVGDDDGELGAEPLDDGAGVSAFGRHN